MSYEIIKSLKIRQDSDDWVADICSHSNNITPAYYEKWVYTIGSFGYFKTKEELTKSLLLDFWEGNLQGGSNTKIGKFIKFLTTQDDTWYKDITDRYNHLVKLQREKTGDKIDFTLKVRKDKECMRALYKMFTEFKPKCKPTIISVSKDDLLDIPFREKLSFLQCLKTVLQNTLILHAYTTLLKQLRKTVIIMSFWRYKNDLYKNGFNYWFTSMVYGFKCCIT